MSSGTYKGKQFVLICRDYKDGERYLTVRFKDGTVNTVKESDVKYDLEEPYVIRRSPYTDEGRKHLFCKC